VGDNFGNFERLINCHQTLDINRDKLCFSRSALFLAQWNACLPPSHLTKAIVTWHYLHYKTEKSFSTLEVSLAKIYLQTITRTHSLGIVNQRFVFRGSGGFKFRDYNTMIATFWNKEQQFKKRK
jgi:hypothetical protein